MGARGKGGGRVGLARVWCGAVGWDRRGGAAPWMCGEVYIGGGGRWGDEGGMCVGEVGTVPAAGSVGACTCGLDRQWGRRERRRRCDAGSAGGR